MTTLINDSFATAAATSGTKSSYTKGSAASLPLVSVIIPYYNHPTFILQTIESVKRQTYPNIELIIVDDGSREPAANVLADVEGVTLYTTVNQGCPSARNYGFDRSSGEYLVFLDGDDLLHPRTVDANLRALELNPEAVLSFGAVRVVDEQGAQLQPPRVCRPHRNYFCMLLETNPIWSCGATMMRREAFMRAGKFRVYRSFQVDDYEIYLYLARLGTFAQHTETVLDYRRHSTNMSSNRPEMLQATLAALDRLPTEVRLSLCERVLRRHGKARWIHSYRDDGSFIESLWKFYFRCASAWNIAGGTNEKMASIYEPDDRIEDCPSVCGIEALSIGK